MSASVFTYLKANIELDDDRFNQIYPPAIQQLARRHWTPVAIAKKAAEFLVPFAGAKVLDIGSGAGKFCLVGASSTQGHFTGVEQRENLIRLSKRLARENEIHNAHFLHANVAEVDFSAYDSFYFYNSFQEHLDETARIDDQVELGEQYYRYYTDYIHIELCKKNIGTRLVTYWTYPSAIPKTYKLQYTSNEGLLMFWMKTV